jgi:uncharacterized membrane protein YebE (DUF533 family)
MNRSLLLIIGLLCAAAGYFGYSFYRNWKNKKKSRDSNS